MPVGLLVYCMVISGSGANVICSFASGARHAAVTAVAQVIGAGHLLAEHRAQVLPHVLMPAAVLAARRLVEARVAPLELLAQRRAETIAQGRVGEALPRGVQDRDPGVVDPAVV